MFWHKLFSKKKKAQTLTQLKTKIKHMEDYLGPRVNYNSDHYPMHLPDRWIFEYCTQLKEEYYARKKRKRLF